MVAIRIAQTSEEIQAVAGLFREYSQWCKQEFVRTGILSADAPELIHFNDENLPGKYVAPDGLLMLASLNDNPAGCMFLRKLDEQVCELKRFYLRPEARGQGNAVAMLDAFCEEARKLGYRRVRISSHHFMTKALGIYKRYGFYEVMPYDPDPLQAGSASMEFNLSRVPKT